MAIAVPAPATFPEPVAGRPVLTDRGTAARVLYRFLAVVRDLGAADRAAILALLELELADVVGGAS